MQAARILCALWAPGVGRSMMSVVHDVRCEMMAEKKKGREWEERK